MPRLKKTAANPEETTKVLAALESIKNEMDQIEAIWKNAEENDESLESTIAEAYPFDNLNFNQLVYGIETWIRNIETKK
jgi:hypothetical protein